MATPLPHFLNRQHEYRLGKCPRIAMLPSGRSMELEDATAWWLNRQPPAWHSLHISVRQRREIQQSTATVLA